MAFDHISQMLTIWITILVAFNRHIAICHPFLATKLITKYRTNIYLCAICIIILLYNMPYFFEYRIESKDNVNLIYELAHKTRLTYKIVYEICSYCAFVFIEPLLILVFFNVALIREHIKSKKRNPNQNIFDDNMTLPFKADVSHNT
ncbi:hypothetical protein A3Q56_04980 [Intoshia linei]|uniref:G-protein coupled receptors family 1 profile domain-containing protein n=1 Tax=Intoshia linei TaxID=1819745 RepID=A0A177AZ96_9BILA|nr:hypothetical protein A3Q56_04980 [Intoshia linei]